MVTYWLDRSGGEVIYSVQIMQGKVGSVRRFTSLVKAQFYLGKKNVVFKEVPQTL